MSHKEYHDGIDFIKLNSGTEEEERHRLAEWERLTKPLIGKETYYPQWVL